jgi:uncharacterized protein YjdB
VLKSEFSNYSAVFGRGNYLTRELLALVEHAEQYPQTAAQLETLFNADVARVQAAIGAAKDRLLGTATSLVLTPSTVTIGILETALLVATVLPVGAPGTTTYVSSAPSVATVNSSGLVSGVSVGTATITATRGSVSDTGVITVESGS